MPHGDPSSTGPAQRGRRARRLIAAAAISLVAVAAIIATIPVVQRIGYTTNVTIALSYVGDDGRSYSCTYDYRTPNRLPMPAAIAASMNGRDWSQTGQLIYEWAKSHPAESWTTEDELPADDSRSTRPDASWSLAMDRYIEFPTWTIDAGSGPEYELWWEVRAGSNCEDGLR